VLLLLVKHGEKIYLYPAIIIKYTIIITKKGKCSLISPVRLVRGLRPG